MIDPAMRKSTGSGTLVREPAATVWAPLHRPLFRSLWIAALVSNVGTWLQEVGASWMMATLTASPTLIAMVQAASTLPIVLLAIAAGALADVVDRRRLLLTTQAWMFAASAGLGVLTVIGFADARLLLAGTFLLGLGMALNAPAWQAIIPELVPREELAAALTLNGVGINLARAAGPALGGLVVASLGPGWTFLLNAASFLGVLLVLFSWRRSPRTSYLPAETFFGAIRAGLRYARHAPQLRAVLARAGAFALCGSALWALLPVKARYEMGRGPSDFGLLLACLGAGAIGGALLLSRARRVLSTDALVAVATLLAGVVLLLLGVVRSLWGVAVLLVIAGGSWIALLTAFHASAQVSLAPWVRGRGLGVFLLVLFGGLCGGSVVWGVVAEQVGLRPAYVLAGCGAIAGLLATRRARLPSGEGPDLAPSRHWPASVVAGEPDAGRGPVLVTVEYRIDPAAADEFAGAMSDVRRMRLRDGAIRWDLLNDPADPGRYVESFLVSSWIEHLRQHERITAADRAIEQRARRFHVGPLPPVVSHFIAKELPR